MSTAWAYPYCSTCTRHRPVPGVGPLPSRIMFLGEGPGWEEHKRLVPFVGKSGRELNGQYLPMAGISRDDIRITNAMKCMPIGERPEQEHVDTCAAKFLPAELRQCQPDLIVTLGAMALRLFGEYDLEMEHGLPLADQAYGDWHGTVFSIYHPAAGLHKSAFMIPLQEDFHALWLYRHGKLTRAVDRWPNPEYRELRTADDFSQVLHQPFVSEHCTPWGPAAIGQSAGIDTEFIAGVIWCLTFSFQPGTGYMIRADNHELLRHFTRWVESMRPLLVFHNYLADAPMLRQVGVTDYRFRDTMVRAYHIGSVSQSLKVLCYRLCGMRMQDYDDLVGPYARQEAIQYLLEASTHEMPWLVEGLPWKQKQKRCSGGGKGPSGRYRKHPSCPLVYDEPGTQECALCGKPKDSGAMDRDKAGKQYIWDRAAKILKDVLEKPTVNPLKRWELLPDEERQAMVDEIGPMPRPSIAQVPLAEATWYACRDADGTLRLAPELDRMAGAIGREVRRAA